MRSIIFLFFCLFATVSCEYDYPIGGGFDNFKPQVVVNSIITPDSAIKAELFWSRYYADVDGYFHSVELFEAELYEDGVLIASGEYKNGLMETAIFPKEGKSYSVKFKVPNYGEVRAKTYIPLSVNAVTNHVKTTGSGYRTYQHVKISSIKPKEETRSVWIRTYGEYVEEGLAEVRKRDWVGELYSNNIFADQINAVLDSDDATSRESNVGFERFMRIPYVNITQSLPIDYSVLLQLKSYIRIETENPELDKWGKPIYDVSIYLNNFCVEITSPSVDYDKYYKSIYKQELYSGSPDMPFLGEMVNVYSNIENGLGIFAGRSVTSLKLMVKNNEK